MKKVMMIGVLAVVAASAQAVTVNVYSGFTTDVGGGAPYSDLVGSLTSPDIQFATSTGYAWHPFGLGRFGAEMTGCLRVAADGTYGFTLNSDDGSMLYIDGVLVVDNGGPHVPKTVSGSASLTAGKHPFKVEFFEDHGGPSGVDLTLPAGVMYAPCVEPAVTKTAAPSTIWLAGSGIDPETTTITLSVTGYGGTVTETLPIDVVFGIDSSGSMAGNDPSGLRKSAAKSFTDKLDAARDQAGVVSWDDNIDFTYGLSNDLAAVKASIDAVDSSGGTNLNVGLNACIAMLDANPRVENSVEAIIFLTDGVGTYTYSGNPGSPADAAAAKGYAVYAIALGAAADSGPLHDLADTTGGQYYSAPSAENLQAIFDAIFTEVIISTAPYNVDVFETTQAYIVDEGSFSIAPDSIVTVDGKTKMTWLNVAQYVGNQDDRLTADETFVVTFTAKSAVCGVDIAVDALPYSKVTYLDPDGNPQWTPIPQAHITVGCPVSIDIKPGSYPNALNKDSKGVIPVAILGSADFDVTQIDPTTLRLEGAPIRLKGNGDPQCSVKDVSGDFTKPQGAPDGYPDLVCQFVDDSSTWPVGLGTATVTGNLWDGTPIQGTDSVKVTQ